MIELGTQSKLRAKAQIQFLHHFKMKDTLKVLKNLSWGHPGGSVS